MSIVKAKVYEIVPGDIIDWYNITDFGKYIPIERDSNRWLSCEKGYLVPIGIPSLVIAVTDTHYHLLNVVGFYRAERNSADRDVAYRPKPRSL